MFHTHIYIYVYVYIYIYIYAYMYMYTLRDGFHQGFHQLRIVRGTEPVNPLSHNSHRSFIHLLFPVGMGQP